jgi:cytochrome P450
MDFISSYIFGLASSTNFIENFDYREHWLKLYKSRNDHGFYDQELPLLTAICRRLGIPFCPQHVDDANAKLQEWCMRLVRMAQEKFADTVKTHGDKPTVMAAVLAGISREEACGTGSPVYQTAVLAQEKTVASELFDHVLAGQETAGVALTYLAWRLSKDPSLQRKLREELLTLTPSLEFPSEGSPPNLPDANALDALPLLHAVVMETLRLHAPIPGAQPRVTPDQGCQLAGFGVPRGVRVAALAYTLHRDEEVFPQADHWDYARWLPGNTTEGEIRERKRAFWAFSSGGRMCIGSNFAIHGE